MYLYGSMPSDTRVRKEALSLAEKGVLVYLLCYSLSEMKNLHKNIKLLGIEYDPATKGGGSPMSVSRLTRYWINVIVWFFKLNKSRATVTIHCHDSPTLIPGIISKIILPRAKLVYDSHESAIDSIGENFGLAFLIMTFIFELTAFIFVSAVITVSPLQKYVLQKRYGGFLPPIYLLRNLPIEEELSRYSAEDGLEYISKLQIDRENNLLIIYATYIGVNRGIPELLEAWNEVNTDGKILLLAGDGPLRDIVKDYQNKLDNFYYLGFLETSKYYSVMKNCDLGLSLIDPESNLNKKIGYPNKITEYLACGVTPLSTRLLNFSSEFDNRAAIPIDGISKDEIKVGINNIDTTKMIQERKTSNKIDKKYLWSNDIQKLYQIYDLQ